MVLPGSVKPQTTAQFTKFSAQKQLAQCDMDDLSDFDNDFPRITPKQIGLDIIAILNFDRGVLFTLKGLFLRPYKTIQSYLKGNRRKHAHPIRILVFSSALAAFLTINLVGINDANVTISGTPEMADDGTPLSEGEIAEYQELKEDVKAHFQRSVNTFIEKYLNVLFIASVPLMALLCWAYYWRKGYNVAEHFVINCFLASVANSFAIVFSLLALAWKPMSGIGTCLAIAYYVYAMMSIYRNNSVWGFFKTLFIQVIFAVVVMGIVLVTMLLVLDYYGEQFGVPIMD